MPPHDEPAETSLAVRDLAKSYGEIAALRGVSFDVAAGEIFGLLGPNGAGKSTLIEAIVGLIAPDAGEVQVCGIDMRSNARAAKQRMGVALQSTGLQERITPREALRAFGAFYKRRLAPGALLERFGLTDKADARYDTLSGGQKQRLALALAFVNDPDLVLLDEPTVGLDPQMRRELHDHILEMKGEGRSILLATHDMEEAEQLCDRIAVIDRGVIVAEGSPRELIARSRTALHVSVETDSSVESWASPSTVFEDMGFRFTTTDLNRALPELVARLDAQGVRITSLKAAKATLEAVIVELTGSTRG